MSAVAASAVMGIAVNSTDAGTWKMRGVAAEIIPFAVGG
jgi:hypothetical protein